MSIFMVHTTLRCFCNPIITNFLSYTVKFLLLIHHALLHPIIDVCSGKEVYGEKKKKKASYIYRQTLTFMTVENRRRRFDCLIE